MVLSKERYVVWLWAALFICASLFTCTRAQDVFVSNDFTEVTCTITTRNCPDVASALNITSSFDSIMIYPGVYSGKDNTNICIKSSCEGLTGIKLQVSFSRLAPYLLDLLLVDPCLIRCSD